MLRDYLRAIFRHWAAAMTGAAGLLASVIAAIRNDNVLFIWMTAGLGLAFLLTAGYRAWRQEHVAYLAELEKNQKPEIKGEAYGFRVRMQTSGMGTRGADLILRMDLCNHRQVPTNFIGVQIEGAQTTPPSRFFESNLPVILTRGDSEYVPPRPDLPHGRSVTVEWCVSIEVDGRDYGEVQIDQASIEVIDSFGNRHPIQIRAGESVTF
ncbi:MAG: hypothetical protein ABI995_04460 [Acidobacteriota bacterium]